MPGAMPRLLQYIRQIRTMPETDVVAQTSVNFQENDKQRKFLTVYRPLSVKRRENFVVTEALSLKDDRCRLSGLVDFRLDTRDEFGIEISDEELTV